MSKKNKTTAHKKGHRFFLNPYEEHAFTKCPRCHEKTKIRKFPLVIHIEPNQMFLLNKGCRYCPPCDLIIAKQTEIEPLMAAGFEERRPEIVGNEYLVVGTMDNFLRPLLIKRGADLPLLLIFGGVIGGLLSFGLIGIFVGPVVLAVAYTLLGEWIKLGEAQAPAVEP